MGWKIATAVATVAALGAAGYAWHLHKTYRQGWTPPPPGAPGRGAIKPDTEATELAVAQFKKGAKAVAEASKQSQMGDVRAHDRNAEKKLQKGG